MEEVLAAVALEVEQRVVGDPARVRALGAVLGRDGEVLELLAEDDDRLLCQERVLGRGGPKVGRGRAAVEELLLRGEEAARVGGGAVELVSSMLEEVEDIVEAVWVELEGAGAAGRGVMSVVGRRMVNTGHARQHRRAPRSHRYLLHRIRRHSDG